MTPPHPHHPQASAGTTGKARPRTGGRSHGAAARSIEDHAGAVADLLRRGPWPEREAQWIPLERATGRVLARQVVAEVDLPPFTNSQMDGYAVSAAATAADAGATVVLRAGAPAPAGHVPAQLEPGQAVPVMTGAPMPPGADAVVPVEECEPGGFQPAGRPVRIPAGQSAGRFVRPAGEDVRAGASVLAEGTELTAQAVGVCASLGLREVLVRPALRVGILTTGDEVVPPGAARGPAQIFDANAAILRAALACAPVEVVGSFHVPDDDAALRSLLRERVRAGERAADLWVTSGGISEGAFEVVRKVLSDPGAAEFSEFLHVAMQPGGPQGLAMVEGIPFVCLPGNPVSTWVSAEMFLHPALNTVLGGPPPRVVIRVPSADDLHPLPGRTRVVRAHWDGSAVRRVGGYGSHLLAAAARANALIILPPGADPVPAGSEVAVRLLP